MSKLSKYNLTQSEISSLLSTIEPLRKSGLDENKMEVLLPMALELKRSKSIPWGTAFYLAEQNMKISNVIGRRRNLPTDRHDTQMIHTKMPGGVRITDLETKKILSGETKLTPTYKHLKSAQGDESVKYREPETKYYYYDEDDKYNHQGNDSPPSDPFTPYIAVQLTHKVGASKYSKPTVTEAGVSWNKESGIKEYGVLYMMGKDIIRSRLVQVPYERDVEFNMYKMKLFKNFIFTELNTLMRENNELLQQLRKSKPKLTPEEIKKMESDKIYKEFYGELEERKRKGNKTRSKRKKKVIVRKPTVVKKRCKCNPKQKRVIKKITRRRRVR